jgi:hypothetical protein
LIVRLVTHLNFLVLLVLLPVTAQAAGQCNPDCTHDTKACVCAIDGRGVTLTAIGGVDRQALRVGQALDPGDEIAGTDPNTIVALVCPRSSSVNLHGRFRSVILPVAPGQDCALSLLAGSADVQTDNPTQLSAGPTLMGSKRTSYGMRVTPDATVACVVFEGDVEVQNLATGAVRPLGPLMSASWKGGVLQQYGVPVTEAELLDTARLYARAETVRARAGNPAVDNPAVLQRELEARHLAVLKGPQDAAARLDLAALQARVRLSVPALYQLRVAERIAPAASEHAAAIAATRWVIYKQDRREPEARREAEKLRTLDPARYKRIQEIDASAAQPAQRRAGLTAVATPPIISPGEATTIAVTVRNAAGQPARGAKVVLSAEGGSFTGARQPSRVDGITSSDGVFRAEWRCQPCASAYQIRIEVSGAGLPIEKTTVGVKIR